MIMLDGDRVWTGSIGIAFMNDTRVMQLAERMR